jgi:hypothetical protein
MNKMKYTYVDGRNNQYTLQVDPQSEEAQFEYRPVVGDCQPQMWGEPVRATLTKDLADQFVHGFEQRQACAASHTTTRAKGTATFRLENSSGQTTAHFMLPYGDAQRPQCEAFVNSLTANVQNGREK